MVVMSIRINGTSPLEDIEVKVGEFWVIMQLILEELEQSLWSDWRFKVDFQEG